MKSNIFFYKGTLIEEPIVTYDAVAMLYTLQVRQSKIYDYSRRSDNNYDVESRNLWITISMSTPHVRSFYTKAEQEGKEVSVSDVCEAIKKEWGQYLSYGLYNRNPEWIGIQEGTYLIAKERISKEECIKYLGIDENIFDTREGMILFSPY